MVTSTKVNAEDTLLSLAPQDAVSVPPYARMVGLQPWLVTGAFGVYFKRPQTPPTLFYTPYRYVVLYVVRLCGFDSKVSEKVGGHRDFVLISG